MRIIIRHIQARGAGKETHQSSWEGDVATIGRATDQTIQLPGKVVPLNHSRLTFVGGRLRLTAVGEHRFTVNDQPARAAVLSEGDLVEIKGHKLLVVPGEESINFVIEVSVEHASVEHLRDRFKTRLWQLDLPQRRLSWFLFIFVLAFGLMIPASGFFFDMSKVRESPLPDDSLWLAGKLHSTHAFMGEDCSFCHEEPFKRVGTTTCLSCHGSVNHHFDTRLMGDDHTLGQKCTGCHQEHNETASLIRRDQAVCTSCHDNLEAMGFRLSNLQPATDFGSDHPPFMVSLLSLTRDGGWRNWRTSFAPGERLESSNLKFPHELHMDKQGIDSPDGTVFLNCDSCHTATVGNPEEKSVSMTTHCADCHQLTFDPATPERTVPHGSPEALMTTLREYYALQFLVRDQQTTPIAAPETRVARRPGRNQRVVITDLLVNAEGLETFSEQAIAWIDGKVAEASVNLFERQTCTICHVIEPTNDPQAPYHVLPIKLSNNWFPLANFSHLRHRNMQCEGCHEASGTSTSSNDVLMPQIESCRRCHGGENSANHLQSTCITCHLFHLEGGNPMGRDVSRQSP